MSRRKKIITAIISLIILLICIVKPNISYGVGTKIVTNIMNDAQLAKEAQTYRRQFVNADESKLITKKFQTFYSKTPSAATINAYRWTASCIDPHTPGIPRVPGGYYQILNLIDISGTDMTIYKAKKSSVEKNSGNDDKVFEDGYVGYSGSLINSKAKKAGTKLAYYINYAFKHKYTHNGNSEWLNGPIEDIRKNANKKEKIIYDNFLPAGYANDLAITADMKKYATDGEKALKNAKKIKKVSTENDIVVTPILNKKKTKTTKTVIGPYKASWKGGTISWSFTAYDANGNVVNIGTPYISNSKGTKKTSLLKSNTKFYIGISNQLPSNVVSFKLKINQKKYKKTVKARVALLSSTWEHLGEKNAWRYCAQNLAIVSAYETSSSAHITWGGGVTDNENKLVISKTDESGRPLSNIQFRVCNTTDSGTVIQWIASYQPGKVTFTTDENQAALFKTDANGNILLENIPEGWYRAKEVYSNNGEYSAYAQASDAYTSTKFVPEDIEFDEGEEAITLTKANKKYTNLRIHKVVQGSNPEKVINGVTFKIQASNEATGGYNSSNGQYNENYESTYQWIASYVEGQPSSLTYTNDENAAMSFTTVNGNIDLRNIPLGYYRAKEVSIPEDLPYGKDPSWVNNISPSIKCGPITDATYGTFNGLTITCQNPWLIKIAGYVYSPEKGGKDEASVLKGRDSKYNSNTDYVVENAKVKLLKNGQEYQIKPNEGESGTSATDSKGWYEYTVRIENESDVNAFSVEFTYDGIDFFAMAPNYEDMTIPEESLTTGATSKATEDAARREELNKAYSEVKGTENADLTKGYADETELNYEFKENQGDGSQTTGTSISEIQEFKTGYDDNQEAKIRTIKSDTIEKNNITAVYNLSGQGTPNNQYNYTNYDIRTEASSSCPDVLKKVIQLNLGIIVREQPDLSLTNKIVGVNADINGFTNMYKTTLSRKKSNNDKLNVGVTYVNEGQLSNFKIYPSDVETLSAEEKDNELKLYITYETTIYNNSQTLYSKANELAIFYDSNYKIETIGTTLNETTNKANDDLKNNLKDTSNRRKVGLTEHRLSDEMIYNTAYVDTSSLVITPNDYKTDDNPNYKNVYVTYRVNREELLKMLNEEGKLKEDKYVPIYKNIVEINSYSTYSDEGTTLYAGIDKNSAPGNVPNEIDTANKNRTEITELFDNDTGYAEEFRIDSKEENRTLTGNVFLDESQGGTGKERTSNGIFEDKEPKLENVTITLQEVDFDSNNNLIINNDGTIKEKENGMQKAISATINDDKSYTIQGFIPGYYIIKYEYNNETYYTTTNGDKININALDYKSSVISEANKGYHGGDYTANRKDAGMLKWYLADNPKTTDKTDAESKTRYTEVTDNWMTRQKIDYEKIDYETTEKNYNINATMDAYTPAFAIYVELNTLSDENKYLPEGYNISNMDFGITERAKQDISVSKKVSNVRVILANGQVLLDGNPAENKQMSGVKYILPSTLNPKGTVDIELDSELIHGATLEITYTVTADNNSEVDYYTENYYKYGTDKSNIVTINPEIYDYVDNNLTFDKENNSEWEMNKKEFTTDKKDKKDKLLVSNEATSNITDKNTIVHNISIEAIEPGKSATSKLILTRVLSNTNDDLSYDNDIEVVEGLKNKGRRLDEKVQVGTYMKNVEESSGEVTGIGASSETVTITPPTGEDKDYTIYIITGIGTLLILAAGIIIIKKKVLK